MINLVDLRFFGTALIATIAIYCLNPFQTEGSLKAETIRLLHSAKIIESDRSLIPAKNLPIISEANSLPQPSTTADENAGTRTRSIRLLVLALFMLFFVPLGIFYPLFLFYRMLLIKPEESDSILFEEHDPKTEESSSITRSKKAPTKATVSKLQIAFTPPARKLRKELSRVSSANVNPEGGLVKLMHQTVEVLIEQGYWTHVSYSSSTLPLELVRSEFDSISNCERHKFTNKQSGLIDYNCNTSSSKGYERNYSYVVVTLILCTTHITPLFQTINTKEQLVEELAKLGKMAENSLISFELLWNPQQENIYISNDRLLIEYDEMIRLL